jgi:hypothetical protein
VGRPTTVGHESATPAGAMHTIVCVTVVCMQVDRLSVTMDPDLGKSVREAAARSGLSVSAWLANAAADRLRNELLGAALDVWEEDSLPFSDKELDEAAKLLGVTRQARGSGA